MRFTALLALLCSATLLCGCPMARSASYEAVQQRTGEVPSVRAALDGQPGLDGPQELVALYVPAGPFALKAGLTYSGETLVLNPLAPQAQAQASPCGPEPFTAPQAWSECDQADPSGRWVYVK